MKVFLLTYFLIFINANLIDFGEETNLNYEKLFKIYTFKNYIKNVIKETERYIPDKDNILKNEAIGSLRFYKNMQIVTKILEKNEKIINTNIVLILKFITYLPTDLVAFLRFFKLETLYNEVKINYLELKDFDKLKIEEVKELIDLELKDFTINTIDIKKKWYLISESFKKLFKYNKKFQNEYLVSDFTKFLENSNKFTSLYHYFCEKRLSILDNIYYIENSYNNMRQKKIIILNILSKITINKKNKILKIKRQKYFEKTKTSLIINIIIIYLFLIK